jgi:hypothetical protein
MDVNIDGVRYVPAEEPCGDPGLLDFKWNFQDAGGFMPIREYLRELLSRLWSEGESFSGKRPFGNSGWEYDLYVALVAAGAVEGDLDEDGCLISIEKQAREKANTLVFQLITEMCRPNHG